MESRDQKRIFWLDSVKGIACWVVFLGHFRVIFTYIPLISEVADPRDYLSFVYNKTAALNIFYVVSAFIAAGSYLNTQSDFFKKAGLGTVKRYLRLSLPVFFSEILIWIFQLTRLWSDRYDGSPARDISFGEILKDSFFTSMFMGSGNVNFVFWMIYILFLGYIVVIVLCAIASVMKKGIAFVFLSVLTVVMLALGSDYAPFAFGILLYLLYKELYDESGNEKKKSIPRYIAGALIFLAGTYLSGQDEQLAFICEQKGFIGVSTVFHTYCSIAAIFMMCGLVLCSPALKLLNNRILAALGKICMPVFLFHAICLMVFGTKAYDLVAASQSVSVHATKAALLVSIISTVLMSLLYIKFIEPLINMLIGRIMKLLRAK